MRSDGSTSRVRVLADDLIDQIAAGEVIERPASVVKELVENALDAGAARIRVEVREGGSAWICVRDDGFGMSPGDARLALRRHATSKLGSAEDLTRIGSFGFRGEALPSIASVSRLRLVTRERDATEGCELVVTAGRIERSRSVGAPVGTRIEVADLFANVPARRKFLKRPSTEWGHVSDWVSRLALAMPGVHFELRRDERSPLVWPATAQPLDRIAAILGEQEARSLVHVEAEEAMAHLHAFASPPTHTRANANGLHLYVNARPVRDRVMRHAVLDVYRDWLPRGRFPTAILFLTLSPSQVDVNVHPAKWEIRFAEPQAIHALVRRGLRRAIAERRWLTGDRASPADAAGAATSAAPIAVRERPAEGAANDWLFATHESPEASLRPTALDPMEVASERLRFGSLRLVGQLLASYLLVEAKQGLLLVDQHAAHERVIYEQLRGQWIGEGVERQGLLAPLSVELEPPLANALADASALLGALGFELEGFGESAVVVRAIPAILSGRNPASLVRELAGEIHAADLGRASLASDARPDHVRLLPAADRLFATLACHAARRAGDRLELREQQAILDSLDSVPWAPTCPHGRPVATTLDLAEIERRFGRR